VPQPELRHDECRAEARGRNEREHGCGRIHLLG
jgi:hypothetical protein